MNCKICGQTLTMTSEIDTCMTCQRKPIGSSDSYYIGQMEKWRDRASQLEKERDTYKAFYEHCSCLFAEGVEVMTKEQIYESIKNDAKKIMEGK